MMAMILTKRRIFKAWFKGAVCKIVATAMVLWVLQSLSNYCRAVYTFLEYSSFKLNCFVIQLEGMFFFFF